MDLNTTATGMQVMLIAPITETFTLTLYSEERRPTKLAVYVGEDYQVPRQLSLHRSHQRMLRHDHPHRPQRCHQLLRQSRQSLQQGHRLNLQQRYRLSRLPSAQPKHQSQPSRQPKYQQSLLLLHQRKLLLLHALIPMKIGTMLTVLLIIVIGTQPAITARIMEIALLTLPLEAQQLIKLAAYVVVDPTHHRHQVDVLMQAMAR